MLFCRPDKSAMDRARAAADEEAGMLNIFGKTGLGIALAAMAAMVATPAQARRYDRGNDDAAIAIGAGVVGLALGAAIASSGHDRYYRDRGYYYDRPYYRDSYYRYDRPRYRYDRRDYRYRDNYRYDRRAFRDRGRYGYYRR
jgi:hypothetical protein